MEMVRLKIPVTEQQEDLLARLAGHVELESAAQMFAYILEDVLGEETADGDGAEASEG